MKKKDKLVLIDGHSILSRAFYGIPDLTNSQGLHTNAVYGFLNIMFKILDEEQADHLAVAFDLKEPTFRHIMYEAYKGTRKPMPEELKEQVPLVQEVLRAMHIPILTMAGYEADDILGTIAKRCQSETCDVRIISGDRDLLQLADANIQIRIPKTSRGGTEVHDYFPEDVKAEYQVSPEEFIDLKALMGDTSDNIPGVPGIGEKTATAIIREYHSIEEAYANAEQIRPPRASKNLREYWDQALLSKQLATINTEVPIAFCYEDAQVEDLYNEDALKWIRQLEFKSLLKRFEQIQEAEQGISSTDTFKRVTDPYMAKIIMKDAKGCETIGFQLFREDDKEKLALALSEDRLYVLEDMQFSALLQELAASGKTKLCTFDLKDALYTVEFTPQDPVYDLGLAAYLLNPLKDSYAYEDLARDYLGWIVAGAKELKDPERAAVLASAVAMQAEKPLRKALQENGMEELYLKIEMPLVYSLFEMQKEGVLIDRKALQQYGTMLRERIDALTEEIYEDCGEVFNINSPQQLGHILFEKMGMKGGKKTKTGYSTAADVLEKLAQDHAVVAKILEYRTLSKLNSTYAEGLLNYISEDGRIHGQFNQMVTATGRISSTEPNLQNIPIRTELGRQLRKVFVPKPGCVFLDADYSQVELRILASLSGDERLIAAYQHADDIHAVTASEVFHIPLEEVTPQLRRNAKAVNFGIVYGISAFGLSEGLSITRKEANEYIARYFETYPDVKKYLDGEITFAKEHGYVSTIYGRRRPVPELKSSNFMQRSFGERIAMNSPIQGSAADIMKKAMNEVNEALRKGGYQSRIVLQVHDELLIEAPEAEAEEVKALLVEKMQQAADLRVELVAEASEGRNWYEAH